ncbi:putative gypsy type transposase, partial [Tanacetum coccineum]
INGSYKSAQGLISMMIRQGYLPQTQTYTALIKPAQKESNLMHYCSTRFSKKHHGRMDITEYVMDRMIKKRFTPDLETCGYVFSAYVDHGFYNTVVSTKCVKGGITDIKSSLSLRDLQIFCEMYYILEEVHPQLPSPNQTIHEMPVGKIEMDLFAFIHTADPLKVKVVERQRDEDKPRLLDTTVGRTVPLLSVAPDRDSSELVASVDRLFDEGGSGDQEGHNIGEGPGVQVVSEATGAATDDVVSVPPRQKKRRKVIVEDAGGPSQPAKKLRSDHGIPSGPTVRGKSQSTIHRLLAGAVLNAEVRGDPIPTLPFVTSSVSTTPKREEEGPVDSLVGANLCTITAPQRFVISDSSHHSGTNIAEAEVDSVVRTSVPIMTAATTVVTPGDVAGVEKVTGPSIFSSGSVFTGGSNLAVGGFTDLSGNDLLVGGIRSVIDPNFDVQKTYVPRWSVTNGSLLDDGRICREMVDEFAPLKFFTSIHGMEHGQLFSEFNVGAARQMSLSAEVRMRDEYNIKEKRKLKSVVEEKDMLLKSKDAEIESLKAQLLIKEAEAAEAIRLRAEAAKFESVEVSLHGEIQSLRDGNASLEREKGELSVRVSELAAFVKVREQEVADLDAQVAASKLKSDNLTVRVHDLEVSSAGLQEKVAAYKDIVGRIEKFQDERMAVMNEKFDKLDTDFTETCLHLEKKFYPHLLTTIAGRSGY